MSKLSPARRAALEALVAADRDGAYVREVLRDAARMRALDARDRGLALRLALGATAASGTLDEALDRYLSRPKKVAHRVRWALRIAAFELLYLGTSPEVAVSQGVELVRSCARSASGLANAVLRRVADGRASFLAADDVDASLLDEVRLARRGGLPQWLVHAVREARGDAVASGLVACEFEPAPIAVCLNPRVEEIAGIGGHAVDGIPGCVADVDGPALLASGALAHGDAVVSDVNAQRVAAAAVRPGSCLEIGAGRGTKTFMIAAGAVRANLTREHVAVELSAGKCAANRARLEAAGLAAGVRIVAGDGCELESVLAPLDAEAGECRRFDTVLIDAPCSGTGTMRRHPEIPWRLEADDALRVLPELQVSLLAAAANRVAAGGVLIYATCSVLASENERVIEAFLATDAGRRFSAVESAFQTMPAPGAYDGHFMALMQAGA